MFELVSIVPGDNYQRDSGEFTADFEEFSTIIFDYGTKSVTNFFRNKMLKFCGLILVWKFNQLVNNFPISLEMHSQVTTHSFIRRGGKDWSEGTNGNL